MTTFPHIFYNLSLNRVLPCPGLPGTLPVRSCYSGLIINSLYDPSTLKGILLRIINISSYIKQFTLEFSREPTVRCNITEGIEYFTYNLPKFHRLEKKNTDWHQEWNVFTANFQVNMLLTGCNITKEIKQARKMYRIEREPKQMETCAQSLAGRTPGGQGHKENLDIKCATFGKNCIMYRFLKITDRVQNLTYFEFQSPVPQRWVYWTESKNDGTWKISSV